MRDFDEELKDIGNAKYSYNFDIDIMHPLMLRSFLPFFNGVSLLEIGSNDGTFTERFIPYFEEISCIEASREAVEKARDKHLGSRVYIVHSPVETAFIPREFDNVVCTHVLEHVSNPVFVLERIASRWMKNSSRLFLVCPNANAASRQIAVKMCLIKNNSAVTKEEAAHGHKRTYSLDTLERDVTEAGLKVIHRSGIFFKALANFQWDALLKTDIISAGYLEGCYQLGQQYPDLCSSIFLVCEKGE